MNPKKYIAQEISGFVPVFEVLVEKYKDPLPALVFGRRWQYCRMSDGVCKASLETLAGDLGLSKATIMRYTNLLVEDGFLTDLTPDARNVPHVYADAGKIIMKSQLSVSVSQRNSLGGSVSPRNATVSGSHLIKDSISPEEELWDDSINLFTVYEQEIGALTPMIADAIEDSESTYGKRWVYDAIREAAQNNKRNWKYAAAILKRWGAQGHQGESKPAAKSSPTPKRAPARRMPRFDPETGKVIPYA